METTASTITTTAVYWISGPEGTSWSLLIRFFLFSFIGLPGNDGMPGVPGSSGPVGVIQDTSGTGVRYLHNVLISNTHFADYFYLFRLRKPLKDIVKKIFVL